MANGDNPDAALGEKRQFVQQLTVKQRRTTMQEPDENGSGLIHSLYQLIQRVQGIASDAHVSYFSSFLQFHEGRDRVEQ